jgi:hypothetical protein
MSDRLVTAQGSIYDEPLFGSGSDGPRWLALLLARITAAQRAILRALRIDPPPRICPLKPAVEP